ncbi:MAG: NAD-dependent deacetylase [Rhizobiales bacterium]|nr:NAD-dependent deacetylase [Hyphomicrobiales bacterium]
MLARWIDESEAIVAFTGAGISTESGVPDFRSPGSPWLTNMPIDFGDFVSDPAKRAEAWRRKFAMDDIYAGVRPSRGHRALAALAAAGKLDSIITQNIDNLHQASGVDPDRIVELHGNGSYARCLSCGARHELADVRRAFEATGEGPLCACGGLIKSATISFGQAMPQAEMRRAQAATLRCDLFIAIGSSLVVQPAAGFPLLAREHGARLVIVNRDPTPLDRFADLVVHAEIGAVLARYASEGL